MNEYQEINSLIKVCTDALIEQGYSEPQIIQQQRKWRRLRKYMEANSIRDYHATVGEDFLNAISERYPSSRKTYRRSVYLLTDYMSCGKIRTCIVQPVSHELPGEIGKAAQNFIAHFEAMRRRSRTLDKHRYVLSYFIRHLSMRLITNVADISEEDVLSFIASTQNCHYSRVNTIRLFCRYLYEQKMICKNIEYVIGRNNFPVREKLPSIYSAQEVALIEASIDRASAVGKRDYAMLLLATRLGLRSSDIAQLQFTNLDWDKNMIRLTQSKTGREIELPLLVDVGEAIINYLKYGRPASHSVQIFLSAFAPYRTINWAVVSATIRRRTNASKVDTLGRKIGPHAMRHTLASQLLQNGVALPVISETLGHASTQTTMEYLRIDIKGLMKCALDIPLVFDDFYTQRGGLFYE